MELLARSVGSSERTLRRAVNEGTLRGTRLSPRVLRMTPAERGYVRRSWPLLATLRAALRTEPNVRFAALFGSAARGDDTESSDIDLLVSMRDASLERVADLSEKLSEATGRRVDVVRLEDTASSPSLLADALEEGRPLVDREDRWAELLREKEHLQGTARRAQRRRTRDALQGIDRLLSA